MLKDHNKLYKNEQNQKKTNKRTNQKKYIRNIYKRIYNIQEYGELSAEQKGLSVCFQQSQETGIQRTDIVKRWFSNDSFMMIDPKS